MLAEQAEAARTLVLLPAAFTPMRPIVEGAFTFVLLLLFLGCMTDMAATDALRTPAVMAGLLITVVLCAVGFQSVRMGSAAVATVYWVLTALLLAAALAGIVKGVLSHAVAHVLGLLLGLYNASVFRGKRFYV